MKEESTSCLGEINYLNTLRTEHRFNKEVEKIIAIYRSCVEVEIDSLGKPCVYEDHRITYYDERNSTTSSDLDKFKRMLSVSPITPYFNEF